MEIRLKTVLASNLFKNISWNAFGLIISRLAILIFTLITVKLLSKEAFSELTYYRNVLNLCLVLAGSSLSVSAIYHSSKTDKREELYKIHSSLFFLSFSLSLLSLIVLLKIPDLLSLFDSKIFKVSSYSIKLLYLPLVFCVIYTISVGFFSGRDKFKEIAKSAFIAGVGSIPFHFFLVKFYGVNGGIMSLFIYYFFNYILLIWNNRKANFISISKKYLSKSITKKVLFFALPLLLSQLIFLPTRFIIETLSLTKIGFEEFALFQFLGIIQIYIVFIISTVSNPIISALNKTQFTNKNKWSDFNFSIIIAFSIFILSLIFKPVLFYFLGEEYYNSQHSETVYYVLMIITFVMIFKTSFFRIITLSNRTWISLESNLIWTICLVLGYFYLFTIQDEILKLCYSLLFAFSLNVVYLIIRLLVNRILAPYIVFSKPILLTILFLALNHLLLDLWYFQLCLLLIYLLFNFLIINKFLTNNAHNPN